VIEPPSRADVPERTEAGDCPSRPPLLAVPVTAAEPWHTACPLDAPRPVVRSSGRPPDIYADAASRRAAADL